MSTCKKWKILFRSLLAMLENYGKGVKMGVSPSNWTVTSTHHFETRVTSFQPPKFVNSTQISVFNTPVQHKVVTSTQTCHEWNPWRMEVTCWSDGRVEVSSTLQIGQISIFIKISQMVSQKSLKVKIWAKGSIFDLNKKMC